MDDASRPCQVVFDLDDTLYSERDFALSGFRAAGEWLAERHGTTGLENACADLFASGQRTAIFDTALQRLGITDAALVSELVVAYRTHRPAIQLAPDAETYLDRRPGNYALITDGLARTQAAKVEALGLSRRIDKIIYTDSWGREFWKPHERAFAAVEEWAGRVPGRLVYVADNPTKDFVTPKRRGWWTVQIKRPDRVHTRPAPDGLHEAHAVVDTFDQLDHCLQVLTSQK
jgi:putative hydrolase of the HAD superfamily